MHIFLDESGSFVPAAVGNAWNSIAAYVVPEAHRAKTLAVLGKLKRDIGATRKDEVKLRQLCEDAYLRFLGDLSCLGGVLYVTLIDMGANDESTIKEHQRNQAAGIVEHIDKMKYKGGRLGVRRLADQVLELPPQLYVQLQCQVILVDTVIRSALLYFVQRHPKALGRFRWCIDQKNATRTRYETVFFALTPGFLQSKSLGEPHAMLEGADYRAFARFEYQPGEQPTYLKDAYGIDTGPDPGIDVGKIWRDDFKFVDSRCTPGVQIADLLAAGIRRTLRHGFAQNDQAAALLGSLMVQAPGGSPPARLITLAESSYLDEASARLVDVMTYSARGMVTARQQLRH
ncbi:MAG: DUF3800 domain-containing protein [Gammaproteobacteria bacterium]|nr:DUF3800 domain-containing protein [Gammaproteobacteria bacterium]